MAVTCNGIEMYDIRTTIKAKAAEAIDIGESCRIANDGKIYVVDDGKSDVCHGWPIEAAALDDEIILATTCRMFVDTTQTPGARLYTGAVAGGSAPSTTFATTGVVVGFAISTSLVFCNIPTPAANG